MPAKNSKLLIVLNIILLIAMLGFFIFMMWYTAYRLHQHFYTISFWALQITVALTAIGTLVIMIFSTRFTNPLAAFLNIIAGYVFMFVIFLFFLLLILHSIFLIGAPPLVRSGIAAIAIAFVITFIGALLGSFFVVRESKIEIKGLKKELRVMQISDVHIGLQHGRRYLAKIVEETNKRNPDMVFITGDLVDAKSALLPGVLEPLSAFKAPAYFVEGNHDKYVGIEPLLKLLEQHGVHILRNKVVETHGIQLIGLDYMKADENTFDMHPSDNSNTVKSVLAEITLKNEIPSILLHHSPVGAQYAETAGINLMLSGHTHGGQIFPFSLFAKLSFPFNSGLYRHGKTKVFVSNGASTYMIRVRLGILNEINLLRLIPENN